MSSLEIVTDLQLLEKGFDLKGRRSEAPAGHGHL